MFPSYSIYPLIQKSIQTRVSHLSPELDQKVVYEWALASNSDLDVSDLDSVPSQTADPPSQATVTFIDGSGPLFSMYNETAAEDDRKVAENWRSDADSAVIAVCRHVPYPLSYSFAQSLANVEWSIFSNACGSAREVIPGLDAQSTGCLGLLSFSNLSAFG
jgi:hypothetical protein